MHVLGQTRGLGEILAEIAVPSSPLHGPRVADKGAPAASGAVGRRRYAAHGMRPRARAWARSGSPGSRHGRCCTPSASRSPGRGQRQIDLFDDLLGIFEGEPVAFRPADRLGVRERRPSIIRAVDIVPDPHGALPEVRAHDARVELLHLVRMAGRLSAGLCGNGRIVAERDLGCGHATESCRRRSRAQPSARRGSMLPQPIVPGREKLLDVTLARDDVQVVVKHDKLQHALVRLGRIVGQAVAEMAVAALGVRMARLLLHLLARHHELGIAEPGHPRFVRMARDALVARLVVGIEIDEEQNEGKLGDKDGHACSAAEEFPEFVDGHNKVRIPQEDVQNNLEMGP